MYRLDKTEFYKVTMSTNSYPSILYDVLMTKKEVQHSLKMRYSRICIKKIEKLYLNQGVPSIGNIYVREEFFPKNYSNLKGYNRRVWEEVDLWLCSHSEVFNNE